MRFYAPECSRFYSRCFWKQLWIGDACFSPLLFCINFGRTWRGSLFSYSLHASLLSPELWALLWFVLPFNAMGCIQSIRCKPKSFRDSVIVLEVNSSIDPKPTSIDESSSVVLRYRTPHFRASARVLVPPVAGKETWTIGWIQACNHMEFYNTYGNKGMWVPPRCLVDPVTKLAGLESRIQHFCTSWRGAVFSTVIWFLAVCLQALNLWRTSQIRERGIKMERSDLSARTRQGFFFHSS